MDFLKDPYSLMMFMSMFKNENNYTIIIILISIILKIVPFSIIFDKISNFLGTNQNEISITISSIEVPVVRNYTPVPITKLVYSKEFLSIIHYICSTENSNMRSYIQILAYSSELNSSLFDNKDVKNDFILMPFSNNKFKIYDNIYCDIIKKETSENNDNEKSKNNNIISNKNHFIIKLTINKNDKNGMSKLNTFIENCIKKYDLFLQSKSDDTKLCIFEFKNSEKSEDNIDLKFNQYYLEHNKDLTKNIFFEGKEKLINYIIPFIYDPFEKINKGEEKYKRAGFTFKAGLLFYGHPGCGKTSTIKAILKYTNRHGIIINLSKVKTCDDLEILFRRRTINGRKFEGKQLCYILEDCDAFENNVLQSRENINKINLKEKFENLNENSNELNNLSKFMESSAISFKELISLDDKLNLSCFLNILDGIIELHGVMIIMTTNHPEKIDKALIRPGRFDFKYEFKRASKKIIKEMLKFKYELSEQEINSYFDKVLIKDEILSPAEIQSICFKNENIVDCINDILIESQK